jgi:hypothetical protein
VLLLGSVLGMGLVHALGSGIEAWPYVLPIVSWCVARARSFTHVPISPASLAVTSAVLPVPSLTWGAALALIVLPETSRHELEEIAASIAAEDIAAEEGGAGGAGGGGAGGAGGGGGGDAAETTAGSGRMK